MFNLAVVTQKFISAFTFKDSVSRKKKICWVTIIGGLMIVSIVLTFVLTLVGA